MANFCSAFAATPLTDQFGLLAMKAPEGERKMTTARRLMLVIVHNATQFHAVDVLRNGVIFCFAYYSSHNMDPLRAALRPDEQQSFRKLVIHVDNARVHGSKMVDEYFKSYRLRRADHPPYSRDLALSACFCLSLSRDS
jgi:hypothetical protein